jgi:phage terminase large subunit-like protein
VEIPDNLTPEQKIELIKILDAKKRIESDKVLDNIDLSLIQKEFVCHPAKIRLLLGANRSGKSEVGAVDTLIRSTGIIPNCVKDRFDTKLIRYGGYWVSSLDFPSSRDITQQKILKFCPKRIYKGFNKEDKKLFLTTESEIGFKSADSGRDKYQGVSRLGIWTDEEHPEEIYDECYMRTTDCSGYITFTFTPVEGLTWAYQKLFKKAKYYITTINIHGIVEEVGAVHTPEEIALLKQRKLVVVPNTSEEADEDIVVFQMSIYDNKFLPDVEIHRAEKKHAADPAQYNARILGRFTKLTGRNVFSIEELLKAQSRIPTTFHRGEIINGQFKQTLQGKLVIFTKELKKATGCYVIGGDIAEGNDNGDYTCFQVLDRRTCEQVAEWHGHCSPEESGIILINLGKFFNNAYIAPERNFHGYGVVNFIRDKKYARLYYDRDKGSEAINKDSVGKKTFGWETNAKTKPIMIQTLASYIRDRHIKINDMHTIDELITYVYDKDGHTGAMGGCFDDRVMALAIALQLFENTPITSMKSQDERIQAPIKINKITGY